MNIKYDVIPRMSLEKFLNQHNLTLVLKESVNNRQGSLTTQFSAAMTVSDMHLRSCSNTPIIGCGLSAEDAVADLMRLISGRDILFPNGYVIKAPILFHKSGFTVPLEYQE